MFQLRAPMFAGDNAGSAIDPANPDYYRTAYVIDATGQSDGTGYTTEESRHAQTITYGGSAAISSGKFEFNGTTDYLSLPTSLLATPGSKWTLEIFGLEFDTVGGGFQVIAAHDDSGSGTRGWYFREQGGNLSLVVSPDGSTTTSVINFGTVSAGTNYDVVLCWNGTHFFGFLATSGGNLMPTASVAYSNRIQNQPVPFTIGSGYQSGSPQDFTNGRMTAVIFTRGEVLYTEGAEHNVPSLPRTIDTPTLTDSNWADVIALIDYDEDMGRVRDFGPLDLPLIETGTVAGETTIEPFADGASVNFGGGKIYVPDDPLLELGSGDFTVETFVRHKSVGSTGQSYIGKYYATTNQRSWVEQFSGWSSPAVLTFVRSSNGTSADVNSKTASYTPTVGTWFHTATCRSGSNTRKFIDGTQSGSTVASVNLLDSNVPLSFGGVGAPSSAVVDPLDGYLSGIRVTKAARYTSGFTVPTERFPRG